MNEIFSNRHINIDSMFKGGGLNQCKDLTETIDIESFYVFFFKNIHLF